MPKHKHAVYLKTFVGIEDVPLHPNALLDALSDMRIIEDDVESESLRSDRNGHSDATESDESERFSTNATSARALGAHRVDWHRLQIKGKGVSTSSNFTVVRQR